MSGKHQFALAAGPWIAAVKAPLYPQSYLLSQLFLVPSEFIQLAPTNRYDLN
jgi:hypothetical protein